MSRINISYSKIIRHSGAHTDGTTGAATHFLAKMHKGFGRFIGEGFDITFAPGDIYYIPKGFRYDSYWTSPEGEVVWDSFAFDCLPEERSYPPQCINVSDTSAQTFALLCESFNTVDSRTVGRFYSLLGELITGMTPLEALKPSELFESASKYLTSDTSLSVGEVAKLCGVSESGLFAEFHRFKTTPVKLRLDSQIERAQRLLTTTELTCDEIGELCGFGSTSYFYRMFRRLTGKTTREFRNEHRM